MSRQPRYELDEVVSIVRLRKQGLQGVVISLQPLKARVTEKDPVFHGLEVTEGIRKAVPKTHQLFKPRGGQS